MFELEIEVGQGAKLRIRAESFEDLKKKAEAIDIQSLNIPNQGTVPITSEPSIPLGLKESVQEFLRDSNARSGSEKALLFAFWRHRMGHEKLTAQDVLQLFRDCMEPKPANINSILNALTGRGLLTVDGTCDNLKAWRITRSGANYVEGNLLRGAKDD